MATSQRLRVGRVRFFVLAALFLAIVSAPWNSQVQAQLVQGFQQRAVGGISIRPDGTIENATPDALGKLSLTRSKMLHNVPDELCGAVSQRKISLRQIEAAVEAAAEAGKPVPESVMFLGGLQSVRYVFVYPEQKDIVLVGPAEGWKVDARGNVVGLTTGRPVMQLDDLIVALRTAEAATQTGITCSIDPTPEGLKQVRAYSDKLRTMGDPEAIASGLEQALGRQQVTFSGVTATSHFAAVLVAADYRMKRLAMNFDKSPIRAMPSFLQMMTGSGRGMSNVMQRWWLEPSYEAVHRDADGLAWEFSGASVKCMTEEDFAGSNGERTHQAKANGLAQRWADSMTKHYDELSLVEPVFGELRNCMDLALVGTLIVHGNLAEKAGCKLPMLMLETGMKALEMPVPSQVDSRVSMLKKGHSWVISASGGVSIRPSEFLAKAAQDADVATARNKAAAKAVNSIFWN